MFDSRLAQEMKHRGLSDIDVALVYLGHEIHHASEPERQGACGVLHSERDVRLLRGAHQALPSEWLDSARALAPMETSKSSTVFVEALDAFDEGTADAVAVWLATKAGVKTPRLSAALAECRKARSTKNHQVSWLLDELDRDGLPQSVEELYVWCWRAALSRAAKTADLSSNQNAAITAALAAGVPGGRAPTP